MTITTENKKPMTMTITKEIEFDLTNQEIGKLIHGHGDVDEMADILDSFVTNIISVDYVSESIARKLDQPARDFFKELANGIKIKEAEEEDEEVPEPAENTMDSFPSLVKELRYTLSLCHEDKDKKLEKVKELVAKGVNINYRPSTHNGDFSAAYLCTLWDLPEVLKYLISVGLDISIPCSIYQDEDTPIVYARRNNKKEIIEILEAAQKPVEEDKEEKPKQCQYDLDFSLYYAIASYGIDEVKEAVKKGANINYSVDNNVRYPAATFAIIWEKYDILQYLVDGGVDLTIQDIRCRTAIQVARDRASKKALEIILGVSEQEESTEKFYKVGDRFVFENKDCIRNGDTFEIISPTEMHFVLLHTNSETSNVDSLDWINSVDDRRTPVTDKNKITEAEWECITDNMVENFTKVKIEAEPKEEPEEKEEKKEEEETFYHVGQLFKKDDTEVYKIISHNGTATAIRFQKIHGNYYIWFNEDGEWTTRVNNTDKITEEEWNIITDNMASSFTPITKEEADKIIAPE